MKWISFVLLGLASVPLHAQSQYECRDASGQVWLQAARCPADSAPPHVLRKCVDAKGGVSYQNAACPAGSREQNARAYQPEYERTYDAGSAAAKVEADRQALRRDNAARRGHGSAGPQGAGIGLASDPDRCERAKLLRKQAFDANWRHRTIEFSRGWDDFVRQECR